ncbi:hypothetical protein Tco_1400137 [Tanacetum coccineum]
MGAKSVWKENAQKRVSFAIDNASRITNILKLTNTLGFQILSNMSIDHQILTVKIVSTASSFIDDSGSTKHMTDNQTCCPISIEKYMGSSSVLGRMINFAQFLVLEEILVQGNIMINRVYYVEGLNQNLFSVGQFCDVDLEVAF